MRRLWGVLVVAIGIACANSAWGGALEDARGLLAEKKYDEVDKALEKLLASRTPNVEALKVSLSAAIAGGRVVTAQKRATALLQATHNNDPALLFQGAEIADRAGQEQLAVSRFLNYLKLKQDRGPQQEQALVYVLSRGAYLNEYKRYIEQYGASDSSWRLGADLLNRLIQANEGASAVTAAGVLLEKFPEPTRVNHVHWLLRNGANDFRLGKTGEERFGRALNVMVHSKPSDTQHIAWMFDAARGQLSPVRRLKLLMDFQKAYKGPLPWSPFHHFSAIREIPSEAGKLSAGKRYLALDSIYRSAKNRKYYYNYLRHIFESPQVFAIKSKAIVSPADIQEKLTALKEKYKDSLGSLHDFLRRVGPYIPDAQAHANFLQTHFDMLSSDLVGQLIGLRKGQDAQKILDAAAKGKSYAHQVGLLYQGTPYFDAAKDKAKFLEAMKTYMMAYPGSFNKDHVRQWMQNGKSASIDEKVAILKEVLAQGGYSTPLNEVVKQLARDKNWNQNAGFKQLRSDLKPNAPATDPLMKAHVKIHLLGRRKGQAAYKICSQVLEVYKGRVPGGYETTQDQQGLLLHGLYRKHLDHAWDRREEIVKAAKLWAPRLDLGSGWEPMVRRLREHGRYAELAEIAPYYAKLVKPGSEGDESVWYNLRYAQNPKDNKTPVLADHYATMGLSAAIDYVRRQERQIGGQAVMNEWHKIATSPGFTFYSRYQARQSIEFLYQATHGNTKPLSRLTRTFWEQYLGLEEKDKGYDTYVESLVTGIYSRAGQAKELEAHWQAYQTTVKSRSPGSQIWALARSCYHLPVEPEGQLKPGQRQHTLLKMLKPLYDQIDSTHAGDVPVFDYMCDAISRMLRAKDAAVKQEANGMARRLTDLLACGAHYEGSGNWLFYLMKIGINDAVAQGDWNRAAREAQYLARNLSRERDWNRTLSDTIKPVATALQEKDAYEIAYAFIDTVAKRNQPSEAVKKQLAVLRADASRGIPDLIPVPKNDPAYNLHVAARHLSLGNEARAWELTAPKLSLLPKVWTTLDAEYVVWCVEQMRKQKMLKEALQFAFTVLIRELDLDPEVAAQALLTKGDIYRDQEQYDAARIEYEGLKNNRRYRKTRAGMQAPYRLIELCVLTHNYERAEQLLEILVDSDNIDVQANAYYYYALIAYERKDYKEAKEYLDQVFNRKDNHEQAILLEGELRLHLRRGLEETEVPVGRAELATICIPGRPLTLKVQDINLSIARGNASIPVIVRTTKGGDEERLRLQRSSGGKNIFSGTVNTGLGKPQKGNFLLEIGGDDKVSYMIDAAFQKANEIQYPPKFLEVRSNARLAASSGEILTPAEQEQQEMEEKMKAMRSNQEEKSARYQGRSGRTVRPGSPIYVQVTDPDRDVGEEADEVYVNLQTTSGDILEKFALKETGGHTGIFRGQVPTGIPFPKASASDSEEGKDPNVVINANKEGIWRSLPDGKKPKWFEVDTMSSHAVQLVTLKPDDPNKIRKLMLLGMLADDYERIASYPEGAHTARGGATVEVVPDQRGAQAYQIRQYIQARGGKTEWRPTPSFMRQETPHGKRDYWISFRVKGVFHLPETKQLVLKFLQKPSRHGWQHAYLSIDGQQVLGGNLRSSRELNRTRKLLLPRGVHRIEIVGRDHDRNSAVIVGYQAADGTFKPLPEAWFSVDASKELAEYLKPKGHISLQMDHYEAKLDKPVRLRRLKWVFEDFQGNAVTVKHMAVKTGDGKLVIPGNTDFAAGTKNRTLEISPGDHIEVTYADEKRLREDRPTLTYTLNSSYFNGEIMLANEVFVERNDRRQAEYNPAKRCRLGDTLIVMVTDNDEDLTDKRDTVKVRVKTSSGENLEVKALEFRPNTTREEDHRHTGVFMALLKIGEQTGKDTIKVKRGDTITVSYLDRENTVPGVPIERNYTMAEASAGSPDIVVYRTSTKLVEDKSANAKSKLERLKMRGQETEGVVIYKEQIDAVPMETTAENATKPVAVSVTAPLLFEVVYPAAALNAGSVYEATVVAESEKKAAEAENREPKAVTVPMKINDLREQARLKGYDVNLVNVGRRTAEEMLTSGTFSGVVRLQIGSPGDPIDDMVLRAGNEFAPTQAANQDEDANRVPTILVSGSDILHLSVKNVATEELTTRQIQLLSDGRIELMDRTYTVRQDAIHLGEKFYLRLTDPDHDTSDERDKVNLEVKSPAGAVNLELAETLPHSGIFSGSIKPEWTGEAGKASAAGGAPAPAAAAAATLRVDFGQEVDFTYKDDKPLSAEGPMDVVVKGQIHHGSDGQVAGFTKRFADPEMAVKTRFLMAEALFEMAKEHRKLQKEDLASDEIAKGKRILEEAVRDYPNTSLAAQGEFLLANLAQELGSAKDLEEQAMQKYFQEAISRYTTVITTWPDSEFAPRSQLKKAICLEKIKNYDQAMEEYVRLTYIYPDSHLVANATTRLGNYYYAKIKNYKVAGKIFAQFQQRLPEHQLASKCLFLAAQCAGKLKDYPVAIERLDLLVNTYTDDKQVRPEAMYWLADAYFQSRDYKNAYRTFKKLTWDYPESKWAKIARGRLTDPQFEKIEEE